jgi:hypothetical protein
MDLWDLFRIIYTSQVHLSSLFVILLWSPELCSYQLKCLSTIHLNSHANYAYFPVQAHCFVLSNIALEFVYLFILRWNLVPLTLILFPPGYKSTNVRDNVYIYTKAPIYYPQYTSDVMEPVNSG